MAKSSQRWFGLSSSVVPGVSHPRVSDPFKNLTRLNYRTGVGHSIVEEIVPQGRHEVFVWTKKVRHLARLTRPSLPAAHPNATTRPYTRPRSRQAPKQSKLTDYSNHDAVVQMLQGVNTPLAFINPMTSPGNRTQKALIDACVAAGVKRFAPSEWAG